MAFIVHSETGDVQPPPRAEKREASRALPGRCFEKIVTRDQQQRKGGVTGGGSAGTPHVIKRDHFVRRAQTRGAETPHVERHGPAVSADRRRCRRKVTAIERTSRRCVDCGRGRSREPRPSPDPEPLQAEQQTSAEAPAVLACECGNRIIQKRECFRRCELAELRGRWAPLQEAFVEIPSD